SGPLGGRGWPGSLLGRLTSVLTAPLSAGHCRVALRRGVALEDALPYIEKALAGLAWQEGRLLLAINNVGEAALPEWRAQGYLAVPRPPDMVLDLAGQAGGRADGSGQQPTYEQYLERLPARHRHELRRVRRRGDALGVRITQEAPGSRGEQLCPLLGEVFARHGAAPDATPFTPALFDALEQEMPGEAVVFVGSVGEELAGFGLGLVQNDTLVWPLLGMRYDLAYPSGLYFLLIDEGIRWGIRHGVRRIHAGVTNEAQKQRHGFHARPRWVCLRARPRALQVLLAAGLRLAGISNS
ncbi:MAG: GNAT family N-acetyltransferase, partial [Chloroflexota bacterium]